MKSENNEEFRDSISTINEEGKRAWVYPKKPSGRFYDYRKYVSYFLLLALFSAPFIKINGNQFLLFDVFNRRFNIFGFPFWPQDFHLVVISMITGVIFVTLFTVAFGRIFCGWICPQTIFLEMVFRRIEYWIEGDRGAQIRLDKSSWTPEKIRKKGLKWFVFLIISFLIANVFLAYLISSDELLNYISEGPFKHISTLVSLIIFTAVFFFVFAWFREQVCIIACPYGRLQGVLLDNKSIVVAYDHKRGESVAGRKKFRKDEDRKTEGYGDCIDCMQCVNVCPTGIDIRNGTQLECVNCTACIDECDTIMNKVGYPKGLIRYASEDEIVKKEPFKLTARIKGYIAVLFILLGLLSGMLFLRNDVEANLLHLRGQVYQEKADGVISNVFTYKLINKTAKNIDNVTFKVVSHKGKIKLVSTEQNVTIPKQGLAEGTLFMEISKIEIENNTNKITVEVYSNNKKIETTTVHFSSPQRYF